MDLKKNKNKDRPKHEMDEEIQRRTSKKSSTRHTPPSPKGRTLKDEDKSFLRVREKKRGSSMAGIDLVTAKRGEKQIERGSRLKRAPGREDSDIARLTERSPEIPKPSIGTAASSPVSTTSIAGSWIRKPEEKKLKKQSPSISVKDLNSHSLDREELSVRQATSTFAATAQVLDNGDMEVWRFSNEHGSYSSTNCGRRGKPEKMGERGTRDYLRGWSALGRITPPVALWRYRGPHRRPPHREKMTPLVLLGSRKLGFDWQKTCCSGS
ncbi:hypothetical protein GWK47_053067 [Chionoecetes opilio]|uniref:Uncharacterized protein n=1 Tax=Chionoecetes opilio TaxID=41210 RepID=A0A8J4XZG4_CHIOP|nr:hypothetical protein GWK47_053067 [Chionoecetes opilio]